MIQPGIEPRSPGPLTHTLTARIMKPYNNNNDNNNNERPSANANVKNSQGVNNNNNNNQQNNKCRICGDRDETINHIISECRKLAQKD